jgi:hypothetical protein
MSFDCAGFCAQLQVSAGGGRAHRPVLREPTRSDPRRSDFLYGEEQLPVFAGAHDAR